MTRKPVTIAWFRRDLRLSDNPSLSNAIEGGAEIIPVYILSPEEEGEWPLGGASKWWLHHSLAALEKSLEKKGSKLTLRVGSAEKTLFELIKETGATKVFWNRLYEPAIIARDTKLKESLTKLGIEAHSFNGALLLEPWNFKNQSGKPFQVFTPFWRSLEKVIEPAVLVEPKTLPSPEKFPSSVQLDSFSLLPKINWDKDFYEHWKPGESGAKAALKKFLDTAIEDYDTGRDIPSAKGTSRLSPHLHFGEISPSQIWTAIKESDVRFSDGAKTYLKEIGWREFGHHLLFHFPHTPLQPLRENFKKFPWNDDKVNLKAWQKGLTGYPIVDAGMRELWATGWMHNRVRMIVSSFLVKHLLISWVEGAKWFWDTLVDASLANNTLGWQWSGGCGADAAPFFRIFNPILQGQKFDKEGAYVRKWVPELSNVPDKYLHEPWEAPPKILEASGVKLGKDYPFPIVDHQEARGRALRAFDKIKG